jgi:hypothetical protein
VIFGALQVTKVLSTEEAKRAIEGSGKDFGKSIQPPTNSGIGLILAKKRMRTCQEIWKEILQFLE